MNYSLIVILSHDKDKVLLLRKNKGPYTGKLNHPGGKIEDESPLNGALRELAEETGLFRVTLEPLVVMQFPNRVMLHVYYTVLGRDEQPQQLEDEPLIWYRIKDVMKVSNDLLAGDGNVAWFTYASLRASIDKDLRSNVI